VTGRRGTVEDGALAAEAQPAREERAPKDAADWRARLERAAARPRPRAAKRRPIRGRRSGAADPLAASAAAGAAIVDAGVFAGAVAAVCPRRPLSHPSPRAFAADERQKEAHMTVGTILLIVALVCFILAAFGFVLARINLIAAGLAFAVAAVLVGSYGLG